MYTHHGGGYNAWPTEMEIKLWVGVAVVWREAAGWKVEGTANFVPNVVIFLLMSGVRQWYVVGAYLHPNDVSYGNCV